MENTEKFKEVTKQLLDIYERKNHDYGDSFNQSLDNFGTIASVVRLSDKFNRLVSLTKKNDPQVEESIEDTLLDMANYCIMTVMYLRTWDTEQHAQQTSI